MIAATSTAATLVFTVPGAVLSGVPRIAGSLKATQAQVVWISVAYPLLVASLLLPAGVIADRYGRRRVFVAGLAVMAAGLVLASTATSPMGLAAWLALAGLGAGMAFPCTLATITVAVPERHRSVAVGVWAAAVPLGGLVGIMLGGVVLTATSDWEPTFVTVGVLVVGMIVLAVLTVPETRLDDVPPLDLGGAVLSVVAVATLVLGTTEAPVHGWTAATTIAYLGTSVVASILFVVWELRSAAPLLDVRVFRMSTFSATAIALLATFFALYLTTSVGFQYEAYRLGFSPLMVAIGMSPMAVPMVPLAVAGPTLANRYGAKPVIGAALLAGAVAELVAATTGTGSGYLHFGVAVAIFGVCVGLCAGPTTEIITQQLPPAKQGVASAVNNLTREIGATLGIAIGGTAFNVGYRHEIGTQLRLGPHVVAIAKDSPIAGLHVAAHRPRSLHVVHAGITHGWVYATATTAVFLIVSLAVFVRRFSSPRAALAAPAAALAERSFAVAERQGASRSPAPRWAHAMAALLTVSMVIRAVATRRQ